MKPPNQRKEEIKPICKHDLELTPDGRELRRKKI